MHQCLTAALEYAEQGLRVLPLRPGTKVPGVRHWPERATSDPDVIRGWWARTPGSNVGIATGTAERLEGPTLVVLDVDTKHGATRPGWAPPTLTAQTASGGLHLYYAVGKHVKVPNSVGRLGVGIDIRGENGQVAAPPSTTAAGDYTWLDERPPTAVDHKLLTPKDLLTPWSGDVRQSRWTFEEVDVPVGQRNDYLTAYAGHLFRAEYTRAEVLEAVGARSALLEFSPRDGEIEAVVRSVAKYHV